MNTPTRNRRFAPLTFLAIPTLLCSAILSYDAFAEVPAPDPSPDAASELEVDGQPPSISAPANSSVPSDTPDQIDIDVQQRSSWEEQQQELQQGQQQDLDDDSEAPPSGSDAPGQDSPDQVEIPL